MHNRSKGSALVSLYRDRLMADLTDDDYEALFAHVTEMVATRCRRTFSTLRDDHIEALHLAIDALAYAWRPDLTARQWLAAAGEGLSVETSGLPAFDCPRSIVDR
jgi:hypothetical protein